MSNASAWPTDIETTAKSADSGVDVRRLFFSHKILLVILTAIGGALGYYKFTRTAPEYASIASVLVARNEVQLPVEGAQNIASKRAPIDTHIALMRTPVILTKAVEDGKLTELPSLAGVSDAVPFIAGHLTVTRSRESAEIIDLLYRSSNREDCQIVLNAIIAAYVDFVKSSQEATSEQTIALITRAKDELLVQLREKEATYQKFRDTSQLVWNGEDAKNIHQQRLATIEDERLRYRMERSMLEAELTSINRALESGRDPKAILMMALRQLPAAKEVTPEEPEDAAAAVATNEEPLPVVPRPVVTPIVEAPKDRTRELLLPLLVREETLSATHGDQHPEMIKVRREIELTRKLLAEEAAEQKRLAEEKQARLAAQAAAVEEARQKEIERRERMAAAVEEARLKAIEEAKKSETEVEEPNVIETYVGSLETEIEVLDGKIDQIEDQAATEESAARVVAVEENRDRVLREDIQRTKRLFDTLFDELQEVSLVENLSPLAVEPVSDPVRGWQVAPKMVDNVVLGSLLGLLAGLVLSFLLEMSDRSFRGPEQITDQLRLPVVGHIPTLEYKKTDKASPVDKSLIAYHRPKSRFAEAYRAIRVPLLFGANHEGLQVLQVTSPDPGDGKSTLAANLAVVMANSGKSTLLVDCDFRRPTSHRLFGIDCNSGLSEVIQEKAEIADVIRENVVGDLDVITTGARPKNVAELILSSKFDEAIDVLKQKYDFIILDSPPVLAVTDASAIAAKVDKVLLTMRITKKVQVHAAQAREMLELVNANILGIVVNGVGGSVGRNYGTGIFSSKSSKYEYSSSPGYGKYTSNYSNYDRYYNDQEDEQTPVAAENAD